LKGNRFGCFTKKGEEHGTITCRINDKENFEITTLRIDVVCDGRRAEVQFTTDWKLDAFRRDLTVNSLFLDLEGTIYDYTGGVNDIKNRRISFVGDPAQRIQEDYLRILRYFRFFGRLADSNSDHELQNIETIIKYRDGLKTISGERIWMELRKILVGRLSASVMRCMLQRCGLGPYLALPGNDDINLENALKEFDRVAAANSLAPNCSLDIEPSTALSSLLFTKSETDAFQKRCKCSNSERDIVEFIVEHRTNAKNNSNDAKFFKYLILDIIFYNGQDQRMSSRNTCLQLLKYINADKNVLQTIADWTIDTFPVNGVDLMEKQVQKGPRMRATLLHLYNLWKSVDLQATKKELLQHVNDPDIDQIDISLRIREPDIALIDYGFTVPQILLIHDLSREPFKSLISAFNFTLFQEVPSPAEPLKIQTIRGIFYRNPEFRGSNRMILPIRVRNERKSQILPSFLNSFLISRKKDKIMPFLLDTGTYQTCLSYWAANEFNLKKSYARYTEMIIQDIPMAVEISEENTEKRNKKKESCIDKEPDSESHHGEINILGLDFLDHFTYWEIKNIDTNEFDLILVTD